jgi:LacI family transcriptional regulator
MSIPTATQQAVADRMGVSRRLVSYALNGNGRVCEETKQRILQAAQEMGYLANSSARAMKSGRFGSVALLLSTVANRSRVSDELWNGIHDELALHDLHLTMAKLDDEELCDGAKVPKLLREWMADGMLIDYTHAIPPRLLELIHGHHLPAIWINSQQEGDCIFPNDLDAGRRAARHLVEIGHQRIVYFDFSHGDRHPHHYSARDRRTGVLEVLRAARRRDEVIELTPGDYDLHRATLRQLFGAKNAGKLGAIAYGKHEVQMILAAAGEAGWSVGRDFSLISFGSSGEIYSGYRISTLVVPEREVGRCAVGMLREKIENPQQSLPPVAVPFGWCAGDSCIPGGSQAV